MLIVRTAIIGLFFFNVCSDNVVQCLTVRYMYHLFFLQINDYVGGLTEVHGQVDGQNNILCNNYIVFPKEASDSFGTYVNYYIWLSNYATILWYWSAVTIFVFPSVDMMSFVNILPGVNKSPSPTPGASNFHIWTS